MDFIQHTEALELDKILKMLASRAPMEDAKQRALSLRPETDLKKVNHLLSETDDAFRLSSGYGSPSFGNAKNIANPVARAQNGGILSMRELLDIAEVLRIIRSLKEWRAHCENVDSPYIAPLFEVLLPNRYFEDKITTAIRSEDEMDDNASPRLRDIRRRIHSSELNVRDRLEKMIRSSSVSKFLQDAIITQRDGRYVIPVRADSRSEVPGLLHDTSSSGATLFIEPMAIVEINNEIRELTIKEQEEIDRILAELSGEVATFAPNIMQSYDATVSLCLIFAKSSLAFEMRACKPNLNDEGRIYLKNARHPLLDKKTVVPVTIPLGDEFDTLIITGPNTGGKTVSIKTVGLLTLMAMCGLLLPVSEGSEIAVFHNVLADIGDEQSIEQSLSTFSSHMVNIISILNDCNSNSLVLFDELCAGTDPIEGAALAKSILMTLSQKGAKIIATTHYPELKAYALDADRVENASCEFDVATLKPTYNLIIGQPGRSNAFAISKRLGLDEAIINLANEQLSEDDLRFESVVASLEKARQTAESERREISKLKSQIAESKKRAESLENEFKAKQEKLMEQAREKATAIVESTRYKSSQLLNELEETKKALNAENAAQNLNRARQNYKSTLLDMEDTASPVVDNKDVGEGLTKAPNVNDIVILKSFNRDATVIKVDEGGKRAFVMSGSMKMWVGFNELKIKKSGISTERPKTRNVSGIKSRAERNVSGEIDLRGMATDEAILELDKYIDEAVLAGIGTITIIHGKGTGVLRKNIQAHLRHHKNIKTFRIGMFGEGENGVTIAEISD